MRRSALISRTMTGRTTLSAFAVMTATARVVMAEPRSSIVLTASTTSIMARLPNTAPDKLRREVCRALATVRSMTGEANHVTRIALRLTVTKPYGEDRS
jgi:hypothetical protein